jgi:dihydrofolate reductase
VQPRAKGAGVPEEEKNMNVILYMAMTANGYIAKKNDDTTFVSSKEWKSFCAMIRKVGNMVVGSRTYEIMRKGVELQKFHSIPVVVVTHRASFSLASSHHCIAKSPKDALAILRKRNMKEALIAGGGTLNASCMKEGLVDEMYLDIEPVLFGEGINLFSGKKFEADLKLLGIKKLSKNELQFHYRVMKKKK